MRLCWITHVRLYERDGCYFGSGYLRFVKNIAELFGHVELCVPVSHEPVPKGYFPMDLERVSVSPLPMYQKRWEQVALLKAPLLVPGLARSISRCDLTWIFLPNYLSVVAWATCLVLGKPFVLGIVGDWGEVYRLIFANRGLPLLGRFIGGLHTLLLAAMIRTSKFTFTVGSRLAKVLGRGNPRVSYYINSRFQDTDIADCVSANTGPERRLLAVGRLDRYKGVIELLKAARILIDEGIRIRVRLAGEGPQREALEEAAREMGIQDNVDFLGWVPLFPDLQQEYRSTDVFVLPSYTEGFPKVVLEAMCNGVPVVATRVGSLADIVRDGRNGLLVEPRNPVGLAGAIRRLLAEEKLRQEIGSGGLATARKFTMKCQQSCIKDALVGAGIAVGSKCVNSGEKSRATKALGAKTPAQLGLRENTRGKQA